MEFDRIIEKYVNAKFEDIPPKERDQCEKVPKKWYQRVQAFAVKRQMRYEETSLKYLGLGTLFVSFVVCRRGVV